jgi:hypothetical protein
MSHGTSSGIKSVAKGAAGLNSLSPLEQALVAALVSAIAKELRTGTSDEAADGLSIESSTQEHDFGHLRA